MFNMNINFNLYRSFYYVAKYEGFTKASYYASISQSSLSSNIKKLEDELNVILFNRMGSKVELTKEGVELYSKLEDVLQILQSNGYSKNEVNIGSLRFIADNYLEDAINSFMSNNKIKLSIDISEGSDLFQKLKKDQLDLVISRYPLFYKFDTNIIIEKLIDVENVFACSYEYFNNIKNMIGSEEYIYNLILPPGSEKRRNIERYLLENNIKYKVNIEIPNSNLLKSLAENNLGIIYINRDFIKDEIKNNKLVVLDNFKNLPIDNICLLYNSKKIDSINESLIDTIKTSIKKTDS